VHQVEKSHESDEKMASLRLKIFSHEILQCFNMFEINKLVKFMEMRKIFDSPLANHFSAVA